MEHLFKYNGNIITFHLGNNNLMINATEMAKPFGKFTKDWLRTDQAQKFIKELSNVRICLFDDLVVIKEGSPVNGGGTWFHEDVALEFARWLNPSFAIWCNDRIKELIKHGITATYQTIEEILKNPDSTIRILTELKKEREEKECLQEVNKLQVKELEKSAPKVKYHDEVLQSKRLIAINIIADELGMTARKLNEILKNNYVQYKQSGIWVLYASYRGQGLARHMTYPYLDNNGNQQTSQHLYWTEKGRQFIHSLVKNGKRESSKLLRIQLSNAIDNQAIPNNSLLKS